MFTLRSAHERGHADHGWLDSHHTFSFAGYRDNAHMGFRVLRVINEDRVAPGMGFGAHPHRDMEIVSYVLEGALEHKDSLGHGAVLRPGEVQIITAGTGLEHSEFNPSADEPVHFYQIWLFPERRGLTPGYSQKMFAAEGRAGHWQTIAARDEREGSLPIHQDASLLLGQPETDRPLTYAFAAGRHGWLQVLRGQVTAGGQALSAGDGLAISDEPQLTVEGQGAEVLLFDLP